MIDFRYHATDSNGDPVEGSVSAISEDAARIELHSRGLSGIKLSRVEPTSRVGDQAIVNAGKVRLNSNEEIELATGLREVVASRMPLAAGLAALAEEVPSRKLQTVFRTMSTQLESGKTIDDIANEAGSALPRYLSGVIRAGAQAGDIAAALNQFVETSRQQESLRKSIHGSFLYIYTISIFAIALFLFLFGWAIPYLRLVLLDFSTDLPGVTDAVLEMGVYVEWYLSIWYLSMPITVLGVFGVVAIARSVLGVSVARRMLYRIPLVGSTLENQANAEFCQLLALQLRSQVELPTALQATAESVRDPNLREAADILSVRAKSGEPLSDLAQRLPHFSGHLASAFSWERKPGQLAEALQSIADLRAAQAEISAHAMQAALQPIAIVGIGLILATVVLSIFMPLIKLVNDLS